MTGDDRAPGAGFETTLELDTDALLPGRLVDPTLSVIRPMRRDERCVHSRP